ESIDRVAQDFPCNRLQQKFVRPRFQCARAIDRIITSRHHDDFCRLELLPDGAANLEAIRLWHQQVAQNNFGRFRRASSTPASPSAASKTFQSACANNLATARRPSSSSSMISTLGISIPLSVGRSALSRNASSQTN